GSVFGFQAGAGSSPRRCSYLGDLTILAWHSPFLVADEIFGLLPCILCGFGDDDYKARLSFGRRRRDSESWVNFVVNSMCADRGGASSQTKNLLDRHAQTLSDSPTACAFRASTFLCVSEMCSSHASADQDHAYRRND